MLSKSKPQETSKLETENSIQIYIYIFSVAGEEYLFKGPATYLPRVEESIVEEINSVVITESQAIKLRAKQELKDVDGIQRKTGDEWLIRKAGAYLP